MMVTSSTMESFSEVNFLCNTVARVRATEETASHNCQYTLYYLKLELLVLLEILVELYNLSHF